MTSRNYEKYEVWEWTFKSRKHLCTVTGRVPLRTRKKNWKWQNWSKAFFRGTFITTPTALVQGHWGKHKGRWKSLLVYSILHFTTTPQAAARTVWACGNRWGENSKRPGDKGRGCTTDYLQNTPEFDSSPLLLFNLCCVGNKQLCWLDSYFIRCDYFKVRKINRL